MGRKRGNKGKQEMNPESGPNPAATASTSSAGSQPIPRPESEKSPKLKEQERAASIPQEKVLTEPLAKMSLTSGQEAQPSKSSPPKKEKEAPQKKQAKKQSDVPKQQPGTSNATTNAQKQQQSVAQAQPTKASPAKKQQGSPQKQQPSTSNSPSNVPQAQGESSSQQSTVSEATTSMPHLLCPYKGVGTRGTKFKSLLETNYLKLSINGMKDFAYHYDVVIVPDKPKKHLSRVFQLFCENNFPGTGIAFDGSRSAYAPNVLSLDNLNPDVDFIHPDTGGVRKYVVKIKETDDMEIPLKSLKTYQSTRQYDMPRRAMQCIEIILKGAYQQPHLQMGVQAARSFYMPPDQRKYLGDFFELWLGLFQSTVLGSHIYLNVDVAHKAFPAKYDSLAELLEQIRSEHRCSPREAVEDMQTHLAGLDVIYRTPSIDGQKRVFKFMRLVGTPSQERFKDSNGRETTVAQYFDDQKYVITRPELPCVKLGNSIKSITVPMEFCSLSNRQATNRKCTENQTREIIRVAATPTDVRKQKIMALLQQIQHNRSPIIRGFGLSVDTDFAKVQARCLEPPKIVYGQNKQADVRNGVWRGEGMPFLIPESANKWAILNANQRTQNDQLKDLARMLFKVSQSTNLNLADTPTYVRSVNSRNIKDVTVELEKAKKDDIRILFCVIPDSGPTYAKIKQLAEISVGVLTQCIKGGTVFRKRNDGSTISNILLKCNAKLNGTNHRLNTSPILSDKCMLIGADVTHPSPDQNIPSVVGVAASHDVNAFCYNVCWRLQGPRVEIIEDFRQIMVEHLKFYRQKNGHLPEKILYYRDGVSEGQFQQVMASEKQAMVQACAEIEPGYEKRVKFTIIVVQKRHHTRFFPGNTEIGKNDRRNNNVPAGTIVDSEITHPNENHFYLVSHQSIQGVAKPTKYCILLDEADHSIDDLQGLSYNLCHLFSRCNRSVSYPAPTYYAHLAAYRGRVYIENERLNMNDLSKEWRKRAIRDDIAKVHPMFFV